MIARWIVNALALLVVAHLIRGVHVHGILAGFEAAAVLGVVNALVRPLIVLLTLPLNVLTLGLFTFAINAALFYLVAGVVRGFAVDGFGSAFVGSLLLTVVSTLLSRLVRG